MHFLISERGRCCHDVYVFIIVGHTCVSACISIFEGGGGDIFSHDDNNNNVQLLGPPFCFQKGSSTAQGNIFMVIRQLYSQEGVGR